MKLAPVANKDTFHSYFDDFHAMVCSVEGCGNRSNKVAWPWVAPHVKIGGGEVTIQLPLFLCKEHFESLFK